MCYTASMVTSRVVTDTDPDIEREMIERYARLSPRERLERAMDLSLAVRQLATARIQRQYGPGVSERELRLRLAALVVDRELLIDAFGWDPEVEGY